MKILEFASKPVAEASPLTWLLVGIGAWLALPAITQRMTGNADHAKGQLGSMVSPPVGAAVGGVLGAGVGGAVANTVGATIGAGLGSAVGAGISDTNSNKK